VPQTRRRETNLSPLAAHWSKAATTVPLQSLNVDPQSPSRPPINTRITKWWWHSEPTLPVPCNLVPDSLPPRRPRFIALTVPIPSSSSREWLNAFRYDYSFLFFTLLPITIVLSDTILFCQVMAIIIILQVTHLGIMVFGFISAMLRFTSHNIVLLLDSVW